MQSTKIREMSSRHHPHYRHIKCFASLLLLVILISGATCDIRCHCNQPVCVRTGYMCKSKGPQAGCFVEHSGYVNVDRSSDISRHGCIEMLPVEERAPCLELALSASASNNNNVRGIRHRHFLHHGRGGGRPQQAQQPVHHPNPRSQNKSIICCLDDMCNYVKTIIDDSNEANQQHAKDNNFDDDSNGANSGSQSRHNSQHGMRHHGIDGADGRYAQHTDDFDNLGRHLQESYGINDSLSNEESFWFELLIFGIVLFLFCVLVLLIVFVVRFIRQDDENVQHKKKLTSAGQLQARKGDKSTSSKKSLLDWRNLITRGDHISSVYNPTIENLNRSFKTNVLHKDKLLLSVKVDVDAPLGITKFTSNGEEISNLPNIISVHNLPDDKMAATLSQQQDMDNRVSVPSTPESPTTPNLFPPQFSRERQNSIYMSLLSAQSNQSQPSAPISQQQQQSLRQTSNLDLISFANQNEV